MLATVEALRQHAAVQANQKVQDAWADVKGKKPLNRRNSQLRSSSSNAAGQQPQQQPQHQQQPQQQQQAQHSSQPQSDYPQPDSQFARQESQNRGSHSINNQSARPSSRGNSGSGRHEDMQGGSMAMRDAVTRMQPETGLPASARSVQGTASFNAKLSCWILGCSLA